MKKSLTTSTNSDSHTRIGRISELLALVRDGYVWWQHNRTLKYEVFEKCRPTIAELESLGVESFFSARLYFFGFTITDEILQKIQKTTFYLSKIST